MWTQQRLTEPVHQVEYQSVSGLYKWNQFSIFNLLLKINRKKSTPIKTSEEVLIYIHIFFVVKVSLSLCRLSNKDFLNYVSESTFQKVFYSGAWLWKRAKIRETSKGKRRQLPWARCVLGRKITSRLFSLYRISSGAPEWHHFKRTRDFETSVYMGIFSCKNRAWICSY